MGENVGMCGGQNDQQPTSQRATKYHTIIFNEGRHVPQNTTVP